jgi:hypothetical protein
MESPKPLMPEVSDSERSPLVDALLELIAWQQKQIEELEQQILKLRGETTKPKPKPSTMDEKTDTQDNQDNEDEKAGKGRKKGPKRKKTQHLPIHKTEIIEPDVIPEGSVFKGYRDVVVQDLVIQLHNTCYRLAQYETADGRYVTGNLPAGIRDGHWGNTLHSFIVHQYHHQHVTQPLLLEYLRDLGVDISSGQLSHLLTHKLDEFHEEKAEILSVGMAVSKILHTDDTGARHAGKNGYCTHIGNELFAWFSSTESKSRVNFLECLSQGVERRYVLNEGAMEYLSRQKLPKSLQASLNTLQVDLDNQTAWDQWLTAQGITRSRHRKIVTEGALIGGLLAQGIPSDLVIMSDDAGQFNVFDHALCWIHAERLINRLIPLNAGHEKAVNWVREQLWQLYADIKSYKLNPQPAQAEELRARFEELCRTKTCYATLNQALKRLGDNQQELLKVLDKPWIPLHNNLSERDIRDYVKKRKISGSTRSEAGRKSRDTFASLKKTCRKHGISFWHYLRDRLSGAAQIPRLAELIHQAGTCGK